MRARFIATASVLAVLAGPGLVLAQTSPSSPAQSPSPSMSQPAVAPRAPAPDPLTMEDVSQIKGAVVYGSDDKKIGDVSAVLMKPATKTVDRLVVSEGGLLGVGAHRVALPIDAFKWDGQKDGFRLAKSADELKQMPEWTAASAGSSTSTAMPSSATPSSGSSQVPVSKPPATGGTGTSSGGSTD
jgi:sporulation protein YlmC with PRC-barrel domain